MAVKRKDLLNELQNTPLTNDELKLIKIMEDYIDTQITKKFDNREVRIEDCYIGFNYNPITKQSINDLKHERRRLMKTELIKRFKDSGWKMELHMDDGLDGPNMSGSDYWIFR